MSSIFDGIKKMSDQEIRIQIALLKNVTVINVAKETGKRFLGGLTNLANAFSETFSRKTPFEYQVTKVSDVVKQETVRLMSKERVQLEYEMKQALIERCSELLQKPLDMNMSEDQISSAVVTEAAKTYGMEQYLTQGRKIEQIQTEYQKMYLQTLHNIMIHQMEPEKTKMDQELQKRLNEVSLETKRELQKRLMPKEFSGKGIGRLLRLEKSTKYLGYTVELLGSECFDYINTNIVTIMNTVKGLKRITRVLIAQTVWSAANAYGARFVVPEDILPGYINVSMHDEESTKEKAFRTTLLERTKAEKQLEKCENAIEKITIELNDTKDRFELESREYDEAQMEFMGLESKKDDYIAGRHTQEESKTYYANVNSTKRKLDSAQSDYNKWKNKLHDVTEHKKKLDTERNTALLNVEVIRHKTDGEVNLFAQKLKNSWVAFYYKFKFNDAVFEQVIINFPKEEQLRIEEMLKEMHDSKDMTAFSIETEIEEPNEAIQSEPPMQSADSVEEHSETEDVPNKQTSVVTETVIVRKTFVNVSSGKNAFIRYQDHTILEIGKA